MSGQKVAGLGNRLTIRGERLSKRMSKPKKKKKKKKNVERSCKRAQKPHNNIDRELKLGLSEELN